MNDRQCKYILDGFLLLFGDIDDVGRKEKKNNAHEQRNRHLFLIFIVATSQKF